MLQEDAKETMFLCMKILLCNAVAGAGYIMLLNALQYGSVPVHVLLITAGAVVIIIFLTRHWMKELHVTLKKVRFPICIMLIPSVMTYISYHYFESTIKDKPFLLVYFVLFMFVLLDVWLHRQFKRLPDVLKKMDPRLEELYPGIFRTDLCRISDSTFLTEMSEVLDKIPEEKIDVQLRDAVIDWYSTYISMIFVMEGIVMAICLTIFYTEYV